jgi:hypothetical protein
MYPKNYFMKQGFLVIKNTYFKEKKQSLLPPLTSALGLERTALANTSATLPQHEPSKESTNAIPPC